MKMHLGVRGKQEGEVQETIKQNIWNVSRNYR